MHPRILAIAAASFLLACGSKSSTEPVTGPAVRYTGSLEAATLTSTMNPYEVAGGALGLAGGFGAMTDTAGGPVAAGVVTGDGFSPRPATVRNAMLMAQEAFALRGEPVAAGLTRSISGTCAGGGTVTVSLGQKVPNEAWAGDFVQVSFAACGDNAGNRAFGSFRMRIEDATTHDEFVSDAKSITTSEKFGLSFAFHDFASVDPAGVWTGVDGALDVAFAATVDTAVGGTGSIQYTVSGARLVSAGGTSPGRISEATALLPVGADASFHEMGRELYSGIGTSAAARTETQFDLDAKVCTLAMGGCVNFLTDPTLERLESDLHPQAGALEIFDGHVPKHFVKVTALDATNVRVEWDFGDASGAVETTWTCLDGAGACP